MSEIFREGEIEPKAFRREIFFILVTPLSPDVGTILYRTSGPGILSEVLSEQ